MITIKFFRYHLTELTSDIVKYKIIYEKTMELACIPEQTLVKCIDIALAYLKNTEGLCEIVGKSDDTFLTYVEMKVSNKHKMVKAYAQTNQTIYIEE